MKISKLSRARFTYLSTTSGYELRRNVISTSPTMQLSSSKVDTLILSCPGDVGIFTLIIFALWINDHQSFFNRI